MVPNVSEQKKTHKLSKQAQEQLLANASSKGVREMAREMGIAPSSVSEFLKSRGVLVQEEQEKRERTAIRHDLDNKDAMCSVMCEWVAAIDANFREKAPDGSPVPGGAVRISGRDAGVLRDMSDTLMKVAKLRGWLVDKSEDVTNRTDQELLALLRGESGRPN